jgi:hypothetical protein
MIYDYKDEERIQEVIFDSYEDLIDDIIDEYDGLHRDQQVCIYAPAYVAKEIVGILLEEYSEEFYVDENSENDLLYDDENEIVITIGDDGMLFVEPARGVSGKFINSGGLGALNYVYDSFKKSDVDNLAADEDSILVFGFRDEDKDEDDYREEYCNKCSERFECDDYIRDKGKLTNKTPIPSTTPPAKEKYTVNGKEVSKKEFLNAMNGIEDRYYDHLKKFLLGWCDVQDEMNEWRKLFY